MDEILRIPARELNILVGSLTPDSSGQLRLRTNRHIAEIDGVAETEEIIIPQENLWVVSTTNQGANYQTSRIDEALKDRFRLFYQKMSPEDIQEIIEIKMEKFKATDREVSAVVSLVEKTEDIQKSGNISRAFTVRHLSEAVDSATSLANVKKKLIELVPNIVAIDSDGAFNPSQVKIITELIKKTI
jgi:MoxR-like ATPase